MADMEHDEHEGLDEASLKEHEEVTKVKNIRTIELGRHLLETWYFSPFPREYYPNGFVDCVSSYAAPRTHRLVRECCRAHLRHLPPSPPPPPPPP